MRTVVAREDELLLLVETDAAKGLCVACREERNM